MKYLLEKCGFVPREGQGQGVNQRPTELELIKALSWGETTKGAAKLLGVSTTTVKNYKNYYGLTRKCNTDDIDKGALVQIYLSGENQRDLADRFNCSQSTVSRILRDAGITTRGKGRAKSVEKRSVWALYAKDYSQELIAEILGCSQSHVSNILNGKIA